jgi:F-box interacting protein
LIGLRRVSQSFNTLIRHRRHFAAQSRIGRRVLFFAERIRNRVVEEHYFYSAEIQKSGALGPATKLPPIPFESVVHNFQPRNGLLHLRSVDGKLNIYCADTGELSTVPDDPTPPLAFSGEPFRQKSYYFGFDPLSNEHKVLLVQTMDFSKSDFWIFTLGSGSWRRIHPLPPHRVHPLPPHRTFRFLHSDYAEEVFANGAIHWMVDDYDSYNIGAPEIYIFSFDMVEEQFRMIPHPDVSFPGKLTELGGRLALIDDFRWRVDVEYDKLHLWILLEVCNNHKWVKETIHLPYAWMIHNEILAINHDTGEMLLQPAKQLLPAKRRVGNLTIMPKRERLLYYNTKTGIFRWTELSGFPHWCGQGKILEKEMEECYFFAVDCAFTDEREKETSFK